MEVAASGFFVLRTPLLAFDEFLNWNVPPSGDCAEGSPESWSRERWRACGDAAREKLRQIVSRPEVRTAVLLASDALDKGLTYWERDPASKKGLQAERALARYFSRMSGRMTPYGLFAGFSLGTIGRGSADTPYGISLGPRHEYLPSIRLDFDFLNSHAVALSQNPALRDKIRYRPNSSLHRTGEQLHYLERGRGSEGGTLQMSAVLSDSYVRAVIDRARTGATIPELIEALRQATAPANIDASELAAYVGELISNDVLVSELCPSVTGPEPLAGLLNQLETLPAASVHARSLRTAADILACLDRHGLTVGATAYRKAADEIQSLLDHDRKIDPSTLFSVELRKPLRKSTLPPVIAEELASAARILLHLGPKEVWGNQQLQKFRSAFRDRYGTAWTPLLESLDEEAGIGFGLAAANDPLVQAIGSGAGAGAAEVAQTQDVNPVLLREFVNWNRTQSPELVLDPTKLSVYSEGGRKMPVSFCLNATVIASSAEAINDGNFRIHVRYGTGPSGAAVFGRICHGDPALQRMVEAHLREEELTSPEVVFAEIVFAPQGRAANLVCRPVLRRHEIVYCGASGAPEPQRIAASELLVSVTETGRIRLFAPGLNKIVVPRLTSAHNFHQPQLPAVYRFLCALQWEDATGIPNFRWGALDGLPHLPRVRAGRVVLSLAQWRLAPDDVRELEDKHPYEAFLVVQSWRSRLGLPRWITLDHADSALPVDLDNPLSVDSAVQVLRRGREAVFRELYPGPDEMCCSGPEGRFSHEMLIPFVRREPAQAEAVPPAPVLRIHQAAIPRALPAGSEWLYLKLYASQGRIDEFIVHDLAAVVENAVRDGLATQWFFIRYSDPYDHIRLRFAVTSRESGIDLYRLLTASFTSLMASRGFWKIQLDTYEREIERYGGDQGLEVSETVFCADSEAVLTTLMSLDGEDAPSRWKATLVGADRLFSDCGIDLRSRQKICEELRDSFQSELRFDVTQRRRLSEFFRRQQRELATLINGTGMHNAGASGSWATAFERRSRRIAPEVRKLESFRGAGILRTSMADLAISYVHMHINRMSRSQTRAQEAILYDLLFRLYKEKHFRTEGSVEQMMSRTPGVGR